MTKLVRGVGVNDSNYRVNVKVNGLTKVCPYYSRWSGMLTRCYNNESFYVGYNRTYKGCTVDERWHSFMAFREWMMQQDWENKDLDKDLLLPGNKVYGPETCVFVDKATNYFLTDSKAIRGEYPIGVTKGHNDKYYACIKENGERKHLGTFDSPEEAHEAWYNRKRELAIALSLTQTDRRVAEALVLRFPPKNQTPKFYSLTFIVGLFFVFMKIPKPQFLEVTFPPITHITTTENPPQPLCQRKHQRLRNMAH